MLNMLLLSDAMENKESELILKYISGLTVLMEKYSELSLGII
jgi:hypothetical protein